MFFRLVEHVAENEGVIEQLKTDKQMEWVARMNNILGRATKIVNHDIIYNQSRMAAVRNLCSFLLFNEK